MTPIILSQRHNVITPQRLKTMKNKFKILILLFAFMLILPTAKADTPITGTAYGENIGLIHFDYTTAYNPFSLYLAKLYYYLSILQKLQ